MGIADLANLEVTMSVDDVLEGLDEPLLTTLLRALRTKQPNDYRYIIPARKVSAAMRDDGFEVSTHEVEKWRRENVD